jgi:hypothetical protein
MHTYIVWTHTREYRLGSLTFNTYFITFYKLHEYISPVLWQTQNLVRFSCKDWLKWIRNISLGDFTAMDFTAFTPGKECSFLSGRNTVTYSPKVKNCQVSADIWKQYEWLWSSHMNKNVLLLFYIICRYSPGGKFLGLPLITLKTR